jgi:hypothetical protein
VGSLDDNNLCSLGILWARNKQKMSSALRGPDLLA